MSKNKLWVMEKENKELLFIDLCGRVPYEVIVCIDGTTNVKLASVSFWEEVEVQDGSRYLYDISDIKPYLFPMYTMTEEQYKTYCELEHSGNMEHLSLPLLEWLNKNHFDYRGLIEKGLAIDATNLNIY